MGREGKERKGQKKKMKLLNYLGEFFQHDRKLQYQLYLNVVFLVVICVCVQCVCVCVCCVHVCVCACVRVCVCVCVCVCARKDKPCIIFSKRGSCASGGAREQQQFLRLYSLILRSCPRLPPTNSNFILQLILLNKLWSSFAMKCNVHIE